MSDTAIATTKARLAAAEAQVARSEIEIDHTTVRAPFAGLVEDTFVEVGTFVQPGSACATVIDLDPMLLVGRISEHDVRRVRLGEHSRGRAVERRARRRHRSRSSASRATLRRARTRSKCRCPIRNTSCAAASRQKSTCRSAPHLAHKVSPSLLALDDEGRVGLRTLDRDNRVEFHRVQMIADDDGSVWVSGLPEVATADHGRPGARRARRSGRGHVRNDGRAYQRGAARREPPVAEKIAGEDPGKAAVDTDESARRRHR